MLTVLDLPHVALTPTEPSCEFRLSEPCLFTHPDECPNYDQPRTTGEICQGSTHYSNLE